MKKRTKTQKKRASFTQLTPLKRDRLEALLREGHSQKDIAAVLKVDPATISREIKRRKKKNGAYDADTATKKARVKRSNSKHQGMKIEKHPELKKHIIAELTLCRSPDEIAGTMRKEKRTIRVSTKAIYGWLYSPFGAQYCRYLCTRRFKKKAQKNTPKREMIPDRVSLTKRPTTGGLIHAQGDTLVSGRKTGSTAAASMVALEQTKLLLGDRLENLKPVSMTASMVRITEAVALDTLTMDNGIENKQHTLYGVLAFFCDPHSPWQKALVEQSIGLLRRWYVKKGTDLSLISNIEYQQMLHYLNHKKRKSLGYMSAYEAALAGGIIKILPEREIAFQPRI